jgi:DMSO/TMAO reductase YedYZ molybdopterin-dependent catalytic subunit
MDRRRWLQRALAAAGSLALSACDRIAQSSGVNATLNVAEGWTQRAQRRLLGQHALAREYSESDISRDFRANGTTNPDSDEYQQLAQGNFAAWRLEVGGLVRRPLSLSLAELRRMPARTQITRHDCVEGWSCIGKWTGTPLSVLLRLAQLQPGARFLAFYCADTLELSLDGTG